MIRAVSTLEGCEISFDNLDDFAGKLDWVHPEIARWIQGEDFRLTAQPSNRWFDAFSFPHRKSDLVQQSIAVNMPELVCNIVVGECRQNFS